MKDSILESPMRKTQTWRVFLDKRMAPPENEKDTRKVLSPENRQVIESFLAEKAVRVKSRNSLFVAVYDAVKMLEYLGKPLAELKYSDVLAYMNVLTKMKSPTPKTNVGAFLKWVVAPLEEKIKNAEDGLGPALNAKEKEQLRELRKCIKLVKESRRAHNGIDHKMPEDMITPKDAEALLNGVKLRGRAPALVARDQAVLAVLWDSGARVGELVNLRIKNIKFDQMSMNQTQDGKKVPLVPVFLHGKTGERQIFLSESVPYVQAWLNCHPAAQNPDASLFLTNTQTPLSIQEIERICEQAKQGAKVQKATNPHAWRHSAASRMAEYMTEQELKLWFGWSGGSRQCATYVHLSGQSLLNKRRKALGIEVNAKQNITGLPTERICPSCGANCAPTLRFCSCGRALDGALAAEIERAKQIAQEIMGAKIEELQAEREKDRERMNKLEEQLRARG